MSTKLDCEMLKNACSFEISVSFIVLKIYYVMNLIVVFGLTVRMSNIFEPRTMLNIN